MAAVAEQVDIIGDLPGLEERRRLGEGRERYGQRDGGQEQEGDRATPGQLFIGCLLSGSCYRPIRPTVDEKRPRLVYGGRW
jgi:hypothetical protein